MVLDIEQSGFGHDAIVSVSLSRNKQATGVLAESMMSRYTCSMMPFFLEYFCSEITWCSFWLHLRRWENEVYWRYSI